MIAARLPADSIYLPWRTGCEICIVLSVMVNFLTSGKDAVGLAVWACTGQKNINTKAATRRLCAQQLRAEVIVGDPPQSKLCSDCISFQLQLCSECMFEFRFSLAGNTTKPSPPAFLAPARFLVDD
jgi:hypothetical protein